MDPQADLLLNPNYTLATSIFRHILCQWGAEFCETHNDTTGNQFLSEIEVICIMHNKMPTDPEHEFLVIETKNRLGISRHLILERTVGDHDPAMQNASPGDGFLKLSKKFTEAAYDTIAGGRPEYHTSIEEGTTSLISSSLNPIDKATLMSARSVDILSETFNLRIDELNAAPAIDQFLGERYVFSSNWHGQNVRYLKPLKQLSLFELAILADTVNSRFPMYALLKEQCFFFSGIIFSAIQYRFGAATNPSTNPSANEDHDKVYVDKTSRLSNRYGRWKGALVHSVDHQTVVEVVTEYEKTCAVELTKVTLHFLRLQHLPTFFIDDCESKTAP